MRTHILYLYLPKTKLNKKINKTNQSSMTLSCFMKKKEKYLRRATKLTKRFFFFFCSHFAGPLATQGLMFHIWAKHLHMSP